MILTVLTEKPAVQRNMLGEPQNDAPRLRLCANDDERYEICISIRDKLIAAHQSHVCHVAISHRLMVDECPSYKRKFDSIKTRDPHRKEKQESEWEYYVGIASKNVAQWEKKRSSLCAAARYWGTERLQYYEWFAQTKHFCKKLAVAAKRVPNWEEAVIKLNQIRLNRHHAVGKQRITADGPEIRCWDLDMLKSWINKSPYGIKRKENIDQLEFRPVYRQELESHGLDKYGLLVAQGSRIEVPLPNYPVTAPPRPSIPSKRQISDSLGSQNNIDRNPKRQQQQIAPDKQTKQISGHEHVRPVHNTEGISHTSLSPLRAESTRSSIQSHFEELLSPISDTNDVPLSPSLSPDISNEGNDEDNDEGNGEGNDELETGPIQDSLAIEITQFPTQWSGDDSEAALFLEDVRRELQLRPKRSKQSRTWGDDTVKSLRSLLSCIQSPNINPANGPIEIHLLSSEEAQRRVETGSSDIPIIVDGDQSFLWDPSPRVIQQLFNNGWIVNLDRQVSVQIPSLPTTGASCELKSLREVKTRFLKNIPHDEPWNLLNLSNPLPPSVLPRFLAGPNCQLIQRVREWLVNYDSAERESLDLRKMKKWHAVTEWALLSEGGHNTGSHMDSHGMGTWITVQEGRIGFGYISPDRNFNWAAWRNDHSYHGHRARYVVLKAGQTVYFPPGTIHFVFRSRKEQTFAIGGHVLQWSNILRFLHVLKEQETDDTVTNEDVTTASGAFWRDPIMGLVQERIKEGAVEMLGGLEVANRIMDILKNWEDCDLKMEDVFDLK
ncbi:hypothetical protein HG531_010756 [Fusarium graminearum]|nr:hypothetical protein HG531_010756 [Fusarium graminearum]